MTLRSLIEFTAKASKITDKALCLDISKIELDVSLASLLAQLSSRSSSSFVVSRNDEKVMRPLVDKKKDSKYNLYTLTCISTSA